jgi:hypothetical protein
MHFRNKSHLPFAICNETLLCKYTREGRTLNEITLFGSQPHRKSDAIIMPNNILFPFCYDRSTAFFRAFDVAFYQNSYTSAIPAKENKVNLAVPFCPRVFHY